MFLRFSFFSFEIIKNYFLKILIKLKIPEHEWFARSIFDLKFSLQLGHCFGIILPVFFEWKILAWPFIIWEFFSNKTSFSQIEHLTNGLGTTRKTLYLLSKAQFFFSLFSSLTNCSLRALILWSIAQWDLQKNNESNNLWHKLQQNLWLTLLIKGGVFKLIKQVFFSFW